MTAIDPRFERSVRRALRAYPRHWRTAKAAEVTAVLADLSAPGATRLDARSAAGLVLAGWRERLRARPPLHLLLAYRFLDRRLPARYRPWVRDDIERPLYGAQRLLWGFLPLIAVNLVNWFQSGALLFGADMFRLWALMWVVSTLFYGPRQRRTEARKHLVPDAGEAWTPDALLYGWIMHDRLRALPLLNWLVGTTAVVALTATVASFRAGTAAVAVLAGAAVGSASALLAARRLRIVLPQRSEQPSRRLVDLGLRPVAALVLAAGLPITMAVWDTGLAPYVCGAALAALPILVVARRAAASADADLAAIDVWQIAATGDPPRVDTIVEGLVPALLDTGPVTG